METSAKLNINIENAFITLAKDIKIKMEKRQVIKKKKKKIFIKIFFFYCFVFLRINNVQIQLVVQN